MRECEEFEILIEKIVISRKLFMKSVSECIEKTDSKESNLSLFCEEVKKTGSLYRAFIKIMDKLCIRDCEKKLISEALSRLGEGYLEDDVASLSMLKENLSKRISINKNELEKGERISGALSAAIAVGVVLLFL